MAAWPPARRQGRTSQSARGRSRARCARTALPTRRVASPTQRGSRPGLLSWGCSSEGSYTATRVHAGSRPRSCPRLARARARSGSAAPWEAGLARLGKREAGEAREGSGAAWPCTVSCTCTCIRICTATCTCPCNGHGCTPNSGSSLSPHAHTHPPAPRHRRHARSHSHLHVEHRLMRRNEAAASILSGRLAAEVLLDFAQNGELRLRC